VLVGVLFVKEQKNIRSYFLADRSMGFIVVGISILAALFSGISYLAMPSEVYQYGLAFFLVSLSFFVATPIATIVFLPFFCRSRFYTAYQYLEERFSVPVRSLASALFIMRVLLWLGLATYAPALALEQATGMPLWFTILCTGILTTVYTTLGGMKAVIWTDVMQFFVLIGGQIAIVVVAVMKVPGGLEGVIQTGQEHGKFTLSFSMDPTVRITFWGAIVGGAFMNLVQMATDQVSVQRYLSAKNLREASRALWFKLIILMPVLLVFFFTGLVLFAFYHVHGDPLQAGKIARADQILPYFVVNELPMGVPGLLIAAIYAASMSTISAGINSLTSATVVDFYQRLSSKGRNASEDQQLRLSRYLTLAYGALVIVLAFEVQKLGTLLEASNKVIGLVGGPLLGLFLLGMLTRRTNSPGAIAGWIAGVGILIPVCFYSNVSFLWYTLIGLVATLTVGWAASWLFPPPSERNLSGLIWKERYEEEAPEA
jgi:SSS family transporter